MKIKRIYVIHNIINKGHNLNFDCSKYKIQYVPEARGYLIDDDVLIPESNIKEVLVELDVIKPVKVK